MANFRGALRVRLELTSCMIEFGSHVGAQGHEAPRVILTEDLFSRPSRILWQIPGFPISQKFLQAYVGQRMLDELLKDAKRHRANVSPC